MEKELALIQMMNSISDREKRQQTRTEQSQTLISHPEESTSGNCVPPALANHKETVGQW